MADELQQETPSGSETPGSNPGPEGTSSDTPPLGEGVQGVSVVSDMVTLTAGHEQAFAGFDPTIHAVDANGQPRKRQDGSFALKRGRKPGQVSGSVSSNAPTPGQGLSPKVSNAQMARMLCMYGTNSMAMLLGPDWRLDLEKKDDKEEAKAMCDAVEAYLDATGGMDVSPGMALMLSLSSYGLKRFHTEETVSRWKKFTAWAGSLFRK